MTDSDQTEEIPLTEMKPVGRFQNVVKKLFYEESFFNKVLVEFWGNFPLFAIMIHYTLINAVFDSAECGKISTAEVKIPFIIYWVFLLILVGLISFLKKCYNTNFKDQGYIIIIPFLHGIMSMLLFISWSIIRSKPFQCFDEGIYIAGPIILWIFTGIIFIYHSLIVYIQTTY